MGNKVTAMLRRWSSRGMGTPEVEIPSVTFFRPKGTRVGQALKSTQKRLETYSRGACGYNQHNTPDFEAMCHFICA